MPPLLLLVLALGTVPGLAQRPAVTISDGPLLGITMQTWMGRNISAFRRIPFAEPPLGELRFQDPLPNRPWREPLDAGRLAPACAQIFNPYNLAEDSFDEDCLYLNVFTPQLPSGSVAVSLPVLVYIHGGAFSFNSGSAYGPRYLLDYNLVLVTFNYRLGILGFLSTQDAVVPGNMGLKDMVLALQWVKANIAKFGGNPNDVTISGTSAGASSVQFLFMSRMSRGLFKRGICMSGSSLMPSAFMKAPLFKLYSVAGTLGCPTDNTTDVIDCLRSISTKEVLFATTRLTDYFYVTPPLVFGPTLERAGPNPFMTRYPWQVLSIGDIQEGSVLFSVVTHEGLFPAASFLANDTGISALNTNFLQYAPSLLDYNFTVTHAEMNATSKAIREFYFGDQQITRALNQSIIRMTGDRHITNDVETSARLTAYVQSAPVFFYQFDYRGQYSLVSQLLSGANINWGVGHADDTEYIFNATYLPPSENTQSDRQMIRIMSSLWANFVINGYASISSEVEWAPIDRGTAMNGPINYVYIGSPTSIYPNSTLDFGNAAFWNNLPINEPMSGRPSRDFL